MSGHQGTPDPAEHAENYWFSRHSQSIIFLIIVLAIIGIYEATQIPVTTTIMGVGVILWSFLTLGLHPELRHLPPRPKASAEVLTHV